MLPIKIPQWVDSVRSILSLELVTTYCLIVLGMVVLAILKIIDVQVFLAFLAGFSGTVGSVITFYFVAKKRPDEDKGGVQ